MHRTWHVGIKQMTSANDKQHYPKLARNSRGCNGRHQQRRPMCYGKEMPANVKLNQPCNIGRASPAFVVAYTHCSVDIYRDYPHQLSLVNINTFIFEWAVTLVVSRAHRPSDIDQLQIVFETLTSAIICTINKGLCASGKRRRPMDLAFPHHPWRAHNVLPTADGSYPHGHRRAWNTYITFSLQTTFKQYQVLPSPIDLVLHNDQPTSGLYYLHHPLPAQLSFDVERGLPVSPLS
uniref:Uncharacterized protein n=1 Tax=Solanum lycopersicum TaxID=4081 RepID=A0A3Q7GJ63_SOLLC